MVTTRILCALLLLVSTGVSAADGGAQARREQARAAAAAFAGALKTELMASMQAGGPLAAIEVCNVRAPAIAESVSLREGVHLSRVSARNRNPGNAPNDWQAAVLALFESRLAGGADPANLEWDELTDTGSGPEFRFMKAIPTAALCLQCHGENIAPDVAEKIAELYPGDKATGFREGDLRGAFVVTRPITP